MFKTYSKAALLLLIALPLFGEVTQHKGFLELKTEKTVLSVGGRIELVVREAAPATKNIAKDIIGYSDPDEEINLNYYAQGSRLWLKTRTPSEYGMIRTLIETDFAGTATGTQTNTNSNGLRLRHAYVQVGNWTLGQTNSAFNNMVTLDIIEYPINDTFVRQPLIRYTIEDKNLNYDISFEQPETTLRDNTAAVITPKDDLLPDFVFRTRYYPTWGELGVSLLGRYIKQNDTGKKDSAFGWGTNISTKIKMGADDLRLSGQYGVGIGRYIAYDTFTAGMMDANGNITLQEAYGGFAGYRHWWNPKLRSTFSVAYTGTENITLATTTKEAYSSVVNLLWTPVLNSLIGIEYTNTQVKAQSGDKSDLDALTLCLRYDF